MSSPVNECAPYYEPGSRITAEAEVPVTGKRFVAISGNKQTTDPAAQSTDGGNIIVSPCGAGLRGLGVAVMDAAAGAKVPIITSPGTVVPVTAGGSITAGDELQVTTGGKVVTIGAAAHAALNTGVVGSNNAITWTAVDAGAAGNAVTLTIVDPGGASASLSVDVDGDDVIVSLGRAASAIDTTATALIAAVLEHDTASQKIRGANTGASNGSGLVAAVAKTNLAGGADETSEPRRVGQALADASLDGDCVTKLY